MLLTLGPIINSIKYFAIYDSLSARNEEALVHRDLSLLVGKNGCGEAFEGERW